MESQTLARALKYIEEGRAVQHESPPTWARDDKFLKAAREEAFKFARIAARCADIENGVYCDMNTGFPAWDTLEGDIRKRLAPAELTRGEYLNLISRISQIQNMLNKVVELLTPAHLDQLADTEGNDEGNGEATIRAALIEGRKDHRAVA
jgi:hypothetical protein